MRNVNNNLVSIIIPVYNSSDYIIRAIKHVLKQTYTEWELIIIDDCSTDKSLSLVKSYAKIDKRIIILSLEINSGAAIARNKGITAAKGQYIAFLDSDDTWHPQKLEKQLNLMKNYNSTFSHTSYSLIDENNKELHIKSKCKKWIILKDLVKYNWIGTSTVIYNAGVLGKQYMPNFRNRQDWALWLALIRKSEKVLFIDEPLTQYTVRNNSISANKSKLIKYHWLIYRKILKFNIFYSFILLVQNLYSHAMKLKYVNIKSNG